MIWGHTSQGRACVLGNLVCVAAAGGSGTDGTAGAANVAPEYPRPHSAPNLHAALVHHVLPVVVSRRCPPASAATSWCSWRARRTSPRCAQPWRRTRSRRGGERHDAVVWRYGWAVGAVAALRVHTCIRKHASQCLHCGTLLGSLSAHLHVPPQRSRVLACAPVCRWVILPLHAALPLEAQEKVFDVPPDGVRKV